jgi:hypothetical protein
VRKKERDTMKHLHNHFGFQPPRSPISPTPPEVEIPSFDQRVRTMINSLDQRVWIYVLRVQRG